MEEAGSGSSKLNPSSQRSAIRTGVVPSGNLASHAYEKRGPDWYATSWPHHATRERLDINLLHSFTMAKYVSGTRFLLLGGWGGGGGLSLHEPQRKLKMPDSVVCCVRFSRDGRYVATGSSGVASVYDIQDGNKVWYVCPTATTLNLMAQSSLFWPGLVGN